MPSSQKEPYNYSVAKQLTELREAQNLSKTELGRRCGVSYKHIQQIEAGERNPSVNLIAKLAYGLDVEPRDLMPDLSSER